MAIFGIDKEAVAATSTQALNIVVILIAVFIFLAIIGVIIFTYMQNKKYTQFTCLILGKDGFGQNTLTFDNAGIFIDRKTNNKRLYMKKNNVGLSPDNIPYIQGEKTKYILLLQKGLKNFSYITPNFDDIFQNLQLNVTEEDVNWAVNAYERQKKLFQTSLLMQLLPFLLLAFVSIVILIIFIYFFKNFGVLKDVALAFKEAVATLAQMKSGTIVMQ